jgi:hypothetical protein
VNLLQARLSDDSRLTSNVHTSSIAQPANFQGTEVCTTPPTLVLGFQRVILCQWLLIMHFEVFLKDFLNGKSPNNSYRLCPYRNTHSTQLAESLPCHIHTYSSVRAVSALFQLWAKWQAIVHCNYGQLTQHISQQSNLELVWPSELPHRRLQCMSRNVDVTLGGVWCKK